ncbi:MAG: DUF2782 domain-containing protein [gamma proteobacterium symbiont of Bathyaustriella thionipta]|nr:DUF2782 domain-containing protein [gamma proteobacterium symbiont of Bathyaustriella thionipta]MCU7951102.1 DUF2782 domain-containing protein [gamma proteobacterium symbiont of Bathyaustriella thionipta]MCU7951972.1 DUF2782 domain-containing protein [gamma proteobacterium symbiont of Bathyaustriella thionipta]MCU7957617.1 DUF2782 domain-containing protein [gamma proteobacterium symbiont of Bathyaustriella thionipta]MCU7968749.1 DUF2782 domain-containing protein [gamma proteobacterium symbion
MLSPVVYALLASLLLIVSSTVWAEEEGEKKRKPDEDKVNPLENVDINIIKRDNKTIETHSINGIVYKVKVTPDNAPPYYFYDTDGDGSLETRSNRELSETTVQQWKIFEW